jgi:multidrug efflux pump
VKHTEHDPGYYLERAPVPEAVLHMAVPMIASMTLDLVYNMIDTFFVGRLADTSMLAAVTMAFPFQIVLMGVGQIFGIGGGTLIARSLGEGKVAYAKRVSAVNFYLALASGTFVAAATLPALDPILGLMGATGETFSRTRDFVLITLAGSPFIVAAVALAECVRSEGASRIAMEGMLLSVAVNIVLDPVLIFAFDLKVAGAAAATVAANVVAVAYFVRYLAVKSASQSVRTRDFKPNSKMLADIFGVGSSALLFTSLALVSVVLFNGYSMAYGNHVVAAFGVANRVVQICEFLGQGIFAGVVPLVAFAYASGNMKRMSAVLRTSIAAFAAMTILLSGAMLLFRTQIFALFSSDPRVLRIGFGILTAMLVSTLFTGFTAIVTDLFQATGAGPQANAMAAVRGLALIPVIILGNRFFGLAGVIWSLPAAEILASLFGLALWALSRARILAVPLEERSAA